MDLAKRSLRPLAVVAIVGSWLAAAEPAASAAAQQPRYVALIVFENQSYANITDCNNGDFGVVPDPYICSNLVSGALGNATMTNMTSGVDGGSASGSARQYAYMTSGDNCSQAVNPLTNSDMNTGQDAYSTTDCGKDIFTQIDDAGGVSWHAYSESFVDGSGNTTGCLDGYSDATHDSGSSAIHQNYARRHDPATFYTGTTSSGQPHDCKDGSASDAVSGFPNSTSDGADNLPLASSANNFGHPFMGFPLTDTVQTIVPDLCHDMHSGDNANNQRGSCQVNDVNAVTSASESGNTVTLSYDPVDGTNDFNVGATIQVSNVGIGYDGTWTLTAANASILQYTDLNSGLPPLTDLTGNVADDAWGLDTLGNQIPFGYSGKCSTAAIDGTSCAQIYAGDQWLAFNLPDILNDLGSQGEAIVTWDEGSGADDHIATFVVPGTGATLANPGSDPAASDHASTLRSLVEIAAANQTGGAAIQCSNLDGTSTTLGWGRCASANPLPTLLKR
jgi:hypothetical protein